MDQHLFELALLRATERLIAVLLGGVAIVLGYRLFMTIPQATESSAEADFPGKIKIILTRIGPGVFFALFGTIVVWSSYRHPVTSEGKEDGKIIATLDSVKRDSIRHFSNLVRYNGAGGAFITDSNAYESRVAEVRRTIRVLNRTLDKAQARELVELRPALQISKLTLINTVWQPDWGNYNVFKTWIDDGGVPPMPSASFAQPTTLYQLNDR